MPKIDDSKNQFTVRIDSKRDKINEFIERYEAEKGEVLSQQKDVFYALLKTALSEKTQYNPEHLKMIENMQSEYLGMMNEITETKEILSQSEKRVIEQAETITHLQSLADKQADYKAKLLVAESELNTEKKTMSEQLAELKQKYFALKSNPMQLTGLQRQILSRYIADGKTQKAVAGYNKNGKFDGLFDVLHSENETENVVNLVKCVTFANIWNGNMPTNILSRKQIETAFDKFKSEQNETA